MQPQACPLLVGALLGAVKALAVAMEAVGGGSRTLGSAGCLAGCQSPLSQGALGMQALCA